MSSSTMFIAVQCCQCSTMQVKQQQQKKKKKISKWRCVVCNQMQSVCKVFAQGFVAKDLRGFVQSFNMSRAITQPSPLPQFQEEEEEDDDIVHDDRVHNNKRRSSDWSQFLDPVEVEEQEVAEESDFEPKIVTELPEDLFKKQKLNANANADLLYKPVFSNRNSTAKNVISPNKDPRRYQPFAKGSSTFCNDCVKQDDEGQEPRRKPQLPTATAKAKAKAKGVSKWNDYIAQDDNDNLQLGSGRNFEHQLHYHTLELETINNDQRVEDDVHPDFL